jgi:glycosyltransferase involved in cell wall biosynthesis
MSDRILVLIPCYNCGPQIGRVLVQFSADIASRFEEILVLDNGSKDDTVEQAIKAATELQDITITIARNRANYNLGGSHKAAFAYARAHGYTHVAVLHGDDQGSISDLIQILQSGDHRVFDACLGARFMKGSSLIGYSTFRIFGNHVFNTLFTLGTRWPVKDLGSGLNIFAQKVFENEGVIRYADDLRFNIFLLLGMIRQQLKIKYFPISWREDDQVSNVKMTSQALRTLELLGQSIFKPGSFWGEDHRTQKHAEYAFDPVFSSR